MENNIEKSKELKLSQDKKLLYEFLDSYPNINTNNSDKNKKINNQNNSIDTLINFMQFMNSKNKTSENIINKKDEKIIDKEDEDFYSSNKKNKKISPLDYSKDKSNDLSNDIIPENIQIKSSEIKKKKKIDKLFSNISNIKKDESNNKKLFQNYQYQAVIDEANEILQNKYKNTNENKNSYSNIILPDVLYPDVIIEKIYEKNKKADEETYKEKVYE